MKYRARLSHEEVDMDLVTKTAYGRYVQVNKFNLEEWLQWNTKAK